jgi:hypothetical protein
MQYTADELRGAGTLIKNQLLAGGEYTFYLYRPPNSTTPLTPPTLSGSGYFTYETVKDSKGSYPASTPTYALGTHSNNDGANALISSSYKFSYELNKNGSNPFTSSFIFIPNIDIPVSGTFFRATGDYDMEVSPEVEACGLPQNFGGGQVYPTQLESILGSGTGTVTLTPQPYGIPDRWIVRWDGGDVIETGYISGNPALYNLGGGSRTNFTQSLQGRIAPEGGTYPLTPGGTAPNIIASDGYPIINAIGTYTFNKNTTTSTANVEVYAPMQGTGWRSTLSCPV